VASVDVPDTRNGFYDGIVEAISYERFGAAAPGSASFPRLIVDFDDQLSV
jgi:hypothetical protein